MAALLLALLLSAPAPASPWQLVERDAGVETYRREVADGQLAFRGRAVVPADLWRTVAVLMEERLAPRWAHQCAEAKILYEVSPLHLVTYRRNVAGVPFVADRDMVLDLELVPAPAHERMTLSFRRRADDAAAPPRPGVVRLPAIEGSFRCDAIDPDHTQVLYEVSVDTGGSLPAWLARRATADLPRRTLTALAGEVRSHDYDAAVGRLRARVAAAERE